MRPPTPLDHLDEVSLQVLRALAEGATDQEIAHRVHISTRTVQRLVDNFKTASGTRTRFAAGVAACRLGLLDLEAAPRADA